MATIPMTRLSGNASLLFRAALVAAPAARTPTRSTPTCGHLHRRQLQSQHSLRRLPLPRSGRPTSRRRSWCYRSCSITRPFRTEAAAAEPEANRLLASPTAAAAASVRPGPRRELLLRRLRTRRPPRPRRRLSPRPRPRPWPQSCSTTP